MPQTLSTVIRSPDSSTDAPLPTDLIFAGNGPGELSGWIAPVARAARRTVPTARLTLALTPSQFAGGRELEVVRSWRLFDRILEPATCVRIAAGLEVPVVAQSAALIHMGGDLWLSGRMAARLRRPACALVETTLAARRHTLFSHLFAVSADVAAALAARGVPADKIIMTGDPRVDAIRDSAPPPLGSPSDAPGTPIVSILPGSRNRVFAVAAPYFLRVAAAIHATYGLAGFKIIVSPYLSPAIWEAARQDGARRWPQLTVDWVTGDSWPVLAASTLTVTIPGTNTLELAFLGIPFVVVVDTELLPVASLEGVLEWVTRLPGLRMLRRAVLLNRLSRLRFAALPNIRAGRPIVPELVGRYTPEELAKHVAALLRDPLRRTVIRQALRDEFTQPPGASQAIVSTALHLAKRNAHTP